MRWALVKVCLAVTAMVVVAFAVPLGLVVQEMASDRAFSNAERQAATIGPTLSITTDAVQLRKAVESTQMGAARRMAVHVPAIGDSGPVDIGTGRAGERAVAETRRIGRATTTKVAGGGSTLLQPTALGSGDIAVVEVFVPESEVSNGVATAWLVLAGVALALIVGSVAVADRLGARLVRPAERLADAAHQLGEGRLRGPGSGGRTQGTPVGRRRVQRDGGPGGRTPRQRAGTGRRPVAPAADAADGAAAQRGLARGRSGRRADPRGGGAAGARGRHHHPHGPGTARARRHGRRSRPPGATPPR